MDYTKEAHIFRKKPTTVSAIQWTGTNYEEVKAFFSDDAKKTCGPMLGLDGKPETRRQIKNALIALQNNGLIEYETFYDGKSHRYRLLKWSNTHLVR